MDNARAKRIATTAREVDWVDMLNSIRRNSLLSGIKTAVVNTLSVPMYTAYQQIPLVAGAALHHTTGGRVGAMGFPALGRLWGGFISHMGEAAVNGLTSWRTGTQFFETEYMAKEDGVSRVEASHQAFDGNWGWLEAPQRMLGAQDDFNKTWLTLSYLDAYGYQWFRDEGQSHAEAVESMADVMADPGHEMWDKALTEARRLTFTAKSENIFMKGIQKLRTTDRKLPRLVSNQIVPFIQTPVNVLSEGVWQTPAGLLMMPWEVAKAAEEGDYSQVKARAMQMSVGTMVGMALMKWALGDEDEYPWITGSDLEWTPEKRELYNRRGMPKAQSIRIGENWYSYERWDPLATTLSLSVDAINAWKKGEASQNLVYGATQSLMRASVDKTFFSGISDVAEAISRGMDIREGEDASDAFKRGGYHFLGGYLTGWVPTIIRNTKQAMQTTYPERGMWSKGDEFSDRAIRRLLQRSELGLEDDRPRVALFGEEIPRHTPWSNPYLDFAWKMTVPIRTGEVGPFIGNRIIMNWNRENPKAQLHPRSQRYVRIKDTTIYLSDEQLEEYSRLGGGNARKIIEVYEERGEFDDPAHPTLRDKTIVKKAVERGYRQARMKLLGKWNQDQAIMNKILERRVEKGELTSGQVREYQRRYVAP